VQETARGLDAPVDLVAVPLLALAAGVVGAAVLLRITGRWAELPVLWTTVVAEPGSAKSPALEAVLAPVLALQQEAYIEWQRRRDDYLRASREAKHSKKTPPEPPEDMQHFITTDVTLEALARILGSERSTSPGVTVVMDELAAWVLSFDRYHAQGERQRWLSLWAGMPVKVDRASRDSSLIPRPAVSVCGGISPDTLPLLEAEAGRQDGFLPRILFGYPDTRPMRFVDCPPPSVDLAPALRALRSCRGGQVEMSPGARKRFQEWVNANAEAQEKESFRPLRHFLAKLPRHTARLALVLHCLTYPHNPTGEAMGEATMEAAIGLANYFTAHAHRTYLEFGEGALARRALEALGAEGELTLTQLYEALGRHVKASELQGVRAFLLSQGLIEVDRTSPSPQGERPVEVWRLAPPTTENPTPCEKSEETLGSPPPCGDLEGEL